LPLIQPFRALRPAPGRAAEVLSPPYDVLSSAEARARAKGKPWSFLHISKPEIDLDPAIDPFDRAVYTKAAENLASMIAAGVLMRDATPCYYVYRLTWRERTQIGLAALASIAEYNSSRIRKHEHTTPLKEDDRVRQIEAVNAQTGPVMIAYPAAPAIDAMLASAAARSADVDVTADDGVRHQLWVVGDNATIDALTRAVDALPALYIADGHHRSAAAARIAKVRDTTTESSQDRHPEVRAQRASKGDGPAEAVHPSRAAEPVIGPAEGRTRWRPPQDDGDSSAPLASHRYFLAVLFPHHQMTILDYNRLLRDLNGRSPDQLLAELRKSFSVAASDQPVRPAASNEFGMFLARHWYRLTLRPELVPNNDPIGRLPITLLTHHVIEPLFGIADQRNDKRIDFVGGARGLGELERRVSSGEMAVAFALYPTQMVDLMTVADAGGIMPPKSTWFEPKLADGMVSHVLD
jgi:uncharacterized protein (DUF1015 family)